MAYVKNLLVDIGGAKIPCAVFGKGKKNLILLPGLGDGLTTVKGKAIPMALMYREFMKDFTVYVMSRREPLPENFSTKDMAADVAFFMERMEIEKASVLGVSMGGMIAQHFAADY
ncbi:MAG: alpha/beta hydrolase, partial [Oscillospiraceae bacterium]|nr:alpha/beta hydrolase [Oscillospiraceae bacterium]